MIAISNDKHNHLNESGYSNIDIYWCLKLYISISINMLPSKYMLLGKKDNNCISKQILQYLLRKHTTYSFPEIAILTGKYTHAAVMYNIKAIADRYLLYADYRKTVDNIEKNCFSELKFMYQ